MTTWEWVVVAAFFSLLWSVTTLLEKIRVLLYNNATATWTAVEELKEVKGTLATIHSRLVPTYDLDDD